MTITPEWVQAVAAIVTMIAALAALKIASDGPERSARFAESYRSQSRAAEEREQLRRTLFIALMKSRRQMMHADAIAALNLADVAFAESIAVRAAVRDFVSSAEAQPFDATRLAERYYALIYEIAREIGVSDTITIADIRGGYYPRALSKIDEAALADAEDKIAKRASGGWGTPS